MMVSALGIWLLLLFLFAGTSQTESQASAAAQASMAQMMAYSSCDKIYDKTNSWPGGYQATMKLHVKEAKPTWQFIVQFDSPLKQFDILVGEVVDQRAGRYFKVRSLSWTGNLNKGITLSVPFIAKAKYENVSPKIELVIFDSVICKNPTFITTPKPDPITTTILTRRPPSTTQPPTTNRPSDTAQPSTTSTTLQSECQKIYKITNSWPDGYEATMNLDIIETKTSWRLIVQFDSPLKQFEMWVGDVIDQRAGRYFEVKSLSWNGNKDKGTILKVLFIPKYKPKQTPNLERVIFNNAVVCEASATITRPKPNPQTTTIPITKKTTNPTTKMITTKRQLETTERTMQTHQKATKPASRS